MDLSEARPLRPLLLPAVQHQLVQRRGTVQRSWQPETVLDCFDHLQHTHTHEYTMMENVYVFSGHDFVVHKNILNVKFSFLIKDEILI